MDTYKKPGPHPERPLDGLIKLRADKETIQMVEFCKAKLGITRSDAVRQSIQMLYESIVDK